jgi:hypothetical protein
MIRLQKPLIQKIIIGLIILCLLVGSFYVVEPVSAMVCGSISHLRNIEGDGLFIDSIFNQLGENGDYCYKHVAVVTGNPVHCERIEDIYKLNPRHIFQPKVMGECYYEIAQNQQNTDICDSIEADMNRIPCYTDIALSTKDMSICERAPARDLCYISFVSRGRQYDTNICAKVSLEGRRRSECLRHVAEGKKDSSICDTITDDWSKGSCYSGVALRSLSPELCTKIVNQSSRDICYSNIAQRTKDFSLCDKISEANIQTRQSCLTVR